MALIFLLPNIPSLQLDTRVSVVFIQPALVGPFVCMVAGGIVSPNEARGVGFTNTIAVMCTHSSVDGAVLVDHVSGLDTEDSRQLHS